MTLRVYNTATRSLQEFEPLEAGTVRVYGCGPTIYNHAHIGNFRTFLFFDLVHRYLAWSGYDVRFVMNLTDVDDKVIDSAVESGMTVTEKTEPFAEVFLEDSRRLGIRPVEWHGSEPDGVRLTATRLKWRPMALLEMLVRGMLMTRPFDAVIAFTPIPYGAIGAVVARVRGKPLHVGVIGRRWVASDEPKNDVRVL